MNFRNTTQGAVIVALIGALLMGDLRALVFLLPMAMAAGYGLLFVREFLRLMWAD